MFSLNSRPRRRHTIALSAIALGLVVGMSAPSAYAQSGKGMRDHTRHVMESTDDMLNHLAWGLKLNDDQKREFRPIVERYEMRRQELRDDSSLSNDERRRKMGVACDRAAEDMKRLLYPKQLPKFDDVWDRLMYR